MNQKLKKSKSVKPISKWSEYLFDKKHVTPDPCWHFKDDIAYDIEIMISNLMHKLKVNQDCTPEDAKAMAINLIMEQLLPMQREEASNMQRAMIFSIFFDSPDLEDIRNKYFDNIESTDNNQRLLNGEPIKNKGSIFSFFKSKKKNKEKNKTRMNHQDNSRQENFMASPNHQHNNYSPKSNTNDSLSDFIAPVRSPSTHYEPRSNNNDQAFLHREATPSPSIGHNVTSSPVVAPKSKPHNYEHRQPKKSVLSFFKRKQNKVDYESIKNRARH